MRHVHWRDPALLRAEEELEAQLRTLRALERSLEPLRATAAEDERALKQRAAALARAVGGLEDVVVAAGLELEERLPARKNGRWTTTSVRVRTGPKPAELLDLVGRISLPEGAWLEAARCTGAGCSLVLSAATREEPQRSPTAARPRQLPPKPWWPPSAKVWDRVRQASEECTRLTTAVNELNVLRETQQAGTLVELVIGATRNEEHRTVIARAVGAALAAGMTEVEVMRRPEGLHVSVPQRSAALRSRLDDLGRISEERSTKSATTYVLTLGRGQVRSVGWSTDLPAGYSSGF
ncbi:hypothetical protein [Anaeromyxobacter terrae]|uniref:hypothetical protein n=1 Tax=Anaeromyxobacter terrae TaxID=2925406 RepID=UPI001F58F632|nr:hypothetical protein [Anaeromyxobacter sp. SG22]